MMFAAPGRLKGRGPRGRPGGGEKRGEGRGPRVAGAGATRGHSTGPKGKKKGVFSRLLKRKVRGIVFPPKARDCRPGVKKAVKIGERDRLLVRALTPPLGRAPFLSQPIFCSSFFF